MMKAVSSPLLVPPRDDRLRRWSVGWLALATMLLFGCGAPLGDVRFAPDFGGDHLEGPIAVLPITGAGVRPESDGFVRRTLLSLRPKRDYQFVDAGAAGPAYEAVLAALVERGDPAPADVVAVARGAAAVMVVRVESGSTVEDTQRTNVHRPKQATAADSWKRVETDVQIVQLMVRMVVLDGRTGQVLLSARDAVRRTRAIDKREEDEFGAMRRPSSPAAVVAGAAVFGAVEAATGGGPTPAEEGMMSAIERLTQCLPLPDDPPGTQPGGICSGR